MATPSIEKMAALKEIAYTQQDQERWVNGRLLKRRDKIESDQDVMLELFFAQKRYPSILLGLGYNMNTRYCMLEIAKRAKIFHLYHHKPWRRAHELKQHPCVDEIMQKWKIQYDKMMEQVQDERVKKFDIWVDKMPGHQRTRRR